MTTQNARESRQKNTKVQIVVSNSLRRSKVNQETKEQLVSNFIRVA